MSGVGSGAREVLASLVTAAFTIDPTLVMRRPAAGRAAALSAGPVNEAPPRASPPAA